MDEGQKKSLFIFLWLIGIGLVLGSLFAILIEIHEAKNYCKSVDGEYKLKKFNYFCDNKQIYKFYNPYLNEKYWGFNQKGNFTLALP